MARYDRYDDHEQYEAAMAMAEEQADDVAAAGLLEKLGDHYVDSITLNCDEHDFLCKILPQFRMAP